MSNPRGWPFRVDRARVRITVRHSDDPRWPWTVFVSSNDTRDCWVRTSADPLVALRVALAAAHAHGIPGIVFDVAA